MLFYKMNADGKGIEHWNALQEIGDRITPPMQMACFERRAGNEP
jgi:hypothetical protein